MHCPGFKTPETFSVEDLTIDICVSPRELGEGGLEMSKVVALMVQSFGESLAIPYLHHFQSRCKLEGVQPLPAPGLYSF